MKINNAVFLSYLRCPYKARLLLEGQSGQPTDYETLIAEFDSGYKTLARAEVCRKYASVAGGTDRADSCSIGRGGLPLMLDTKIEHGPFEFSLDTLKRVTDSLKGGHRRVPVIFSRNDRVLASEELLLTFGGWVLRLAEGSYPDIGIIVHGPKFSFKTVRLTPTYPAIDQIVAELSSLNTSERRPPLVLNSHCRACEFQQSCLAEAKQQDSLSLLHRMTQKTIRQYNRKGIFTVNQLSYTFHPRRKSKSVSDHLKT